MSSKPPCPSAHCRSCPVENENSHDIQRMETAAQAAERALARPRPCHLRRPFVAAEIQISFLLPRVWPPLPWGLERARRPLFPRPRVLQVRALAPGPKLATSTRWRQPSAIAANTDIFQ